jgi:AraC-like DNA-binding protein
MPTFVPGLMSDIFYEVEQTGSKDFGGIFLRSDLGDAGLVYSSSWGSPARVARTEDAINKSGIDVFMIVLGVAGGAELRQYGRSTRLRRGSLALIDSGKPYEVEVAKAWKAIWLKVPRKTLEARLFTHRDWLGRSLSTDEGLGFIAGRMMHSCLHAAKALQDTEARFLANSVLDVVSAAFAHAGAAEDNTRSRHTELMLNRIDRFIDQNIQDSNLGPALISQACGISERYLRQLFASRGTTMTNVIRAKRLEECRRLLTSFGASSPSVTEVAFSLGFENISSFNRAFKARFGVTPRQVKVPGRKGAAPVDDGYLAA